MTKKLQLILIFSGGILCGVIFVIGVITFAGRQGWHIGGEVLMPPLFLLLIYFGWSIGTEVDRYHQTYEKARSYRHGYRDGIRKAYNTISMPDACKEALERHGIKY